MSEGFWSNFWSKGWEDSKRESVVAIDFLFHRSPSEHIDALYNFAGDVFGTIILSIAGLITYIIFRFCYRRIGRSWFLKNKENISKIEKIIFKTVTATFFTVIVLFLIYLIVYVLYQLIIVIFILLAWLGKGIPVGGSAPKRTSSTITGTHTTDHMIFKDDETRQLVKKTKDTFS